MRNIRLLILGSFLFLLTFGESAAQNESRFKSTNGLIVMDYSEEGVLIEKGDSIFRYLFGEVEIRQDSVFMYADTALVLNDTLLFANGNVLIQQGDSLSILAENLTYNSVDRSALLDNDVVLLSAGQRLYTPHLNYELNTGLATFDAGALLTNDTTQLVSKRGYFDTNAEEAVFKDSVQVVGESFTMQADSIKYAINEDRVDFLSPTLINHESNKIYCEGGSYLVELGQATLDKRPQYVGEDLSASAKVIKYDERLGLVQLIDEARLLDSLSLMQAEWIRYFEQEDKMVLVDNVEYQKEDVVVNGDSVVYLREEDRYTLEGPSSLQDGDLEIIAEEEIFFDKDTGNGFAKGNVILVDTTNNTKIFCDSTRIKEDGDDFICLGSSMGRPFVLMEDEEQDSLFLVADTLFMLTRRDSINADSVLSRNLHAFNDVRIFRDDMQSLCDSLVFSEMDSIFHLYGDPVAWADSSQFSSDTMNIQMANGSIDKIHLEKNAFVVNSPDLIFFNQLKGRVIDLHFRADTLNFLDVNGNVESLYFLMDENNAYIGMNKMLSAQMRAYFSENKIKRLTFFQQPDGTAIPMSQVGSNPEKLSGFNWDESFRPVSFEDLFDVKKRRKPRTVSPDTGEEESKGEVDEHEGHEHHNHDHDHDHEHDHSNKDESDKKSNGKKN